MTRSLAVVKVGGSLYDLPDLVLRLQNWWLAWRKQVPESDFLFVPGGGRTADVIRHFDQVHQLGEVRAHHLALLALRLNACLLFNLAVVDGFIDSPEKATWGLSDPDIEIFQLKALDTAAFAAWDDRAHPEDALPHCWAVTSDSIAARAAVVFGAEHLILLKSVTIPEGMDWEEAAEHGFVDEWFARTLRPAGASLKVRAVNLREWAP